MNNVVLNDGYSSFMSNVGRGNGDAGNIVNTKFTQTIQDFIFAATTDGIANNMATCVPEDSLSVGFEIDGDGDGSALKELTETSLGFEKAVAEAANKSRIYGGAIIVLKVADGRKFSEEIGKGEIVGFESFSSGAINRIVFDTDQTSKTFGKPKSYFVAMLDGVQVEIHASRCVPFFGVSCPDTSVGTIHFDAKDKYFGISVFYAGIERLKRMGLDEAAITTIIQTLNVYVTQFEGMNDALAADTDSDATGSESVKKKCDIVAAYKSLCNMIVLDSKDKVSTLSTSVAGLDAIMKMRMTLVAAAFGLPMAKVYGETASGLANTGTGDLSLYYTKCETWRKRFAKPAIETIVSEFCKRNLNKDFSHVTFNPISTPTTAELVNLYKIQAETFNIWINDGVLTPEEAKQMVFANGHTFLMNLPKGSVDNGED